MADAGFAPHVDRSRVPEHVGIILDGNGRWANARGLPRTAGHAQGEPALFDVIEGALEHKDNLGNGSVIRPGDATEWRRARGFADDDELLAGRGDWDGGAIRQRTGIENRYWIGC